MDGLVKSVQCRLGSQTTRRWETVRGMAFEAGEQIIRGSAGAKPLTIRLL